MTILCNLCKRKLVVVRKTDLEMCPFKHNAFISSVDSKMDTLAAKIGSPMMTMKLEQTGEVKKALKVEYEDMRKIRARELREFQTRNCVESIPC